MTVEQEAWLKPQLHIRRFELKPYAITYKCFWNDICLYLFFNVYLKQIVTRWRNIMIICADSKLISRAVYAEYNLQGFTRPAHIREQIFFQDKKTEPIFNSDKRWQKRSKLNRPTFCTILYNTKSLSLIDILYCNI